MKIKERVLQLRKNYVISPTFYYWGGEGGGGEMEDIKKRSLNGNADSTP